MPRSYPPQHTCAYTHGPTLLKEFQAFLSFLCRNPVTEGRCSFFHAVLLERVSASDNLKQNTKFNHLFCCNSYICCCFSSRSRGIACKLYGTFTCSNIFNCYRVISLFVLSLCSFFDICILRNLNYRRW